MSHLWCVCQTSQCHSDWCKHTSFACLTTTVWITYLPSSELVHQNFAPAKLVGWQQNIWALQALSQQENHRHRFWPVETHLFYQDCSSGTLVRRKHFQNLDLRCLFCCHEFQRRIGNFVFLRPVNHMFCCDEFQWRMGNLVIYAQSTITVISGRSAEEPKQTNKGLNRV